ncbi:MAG: fatty acyl-AMP ligase [Alphaproteobacteria bacterium]|nr:fatty acyl-AMP ligase [Alphaproteobacteria bacterium]
MDNKQSFFLGDYLKKQAIANPNKPAYKFFHEDTDSTTVVTYRELDALAKRIAYQIHQYAAPNERIVICIPHSLNYIAAIFGCFYAGVVFVPAYPPKQTHSFPVLQKIIEDSNPKLVITEDAHDGDIIPGYATVQIGKLTQGTEEFTTEHESQEDDVCLIQYSSGSTHTPKGVMISHKNLVKNCDASAVLFKLTDKDRGCSWLPPYHDMGLVGNIFVPMYVGFPITFMSSGLFARRPLKWLELMSQEKATLSAAPNFAYGLCTDRYLSSTQKHHKLDLSHWRLAINGAEVVRAKTLEKFAEVFSSSGFKQTAFCPSYGLAESTLTVTAHYDPLNLPIVKKFSKSKLEVNMAEEITDRERTDPDSSEFQNRDIIRLVSSGKPLPDYLVKIVNADTAEPLPNNVVGEIWISGPCVSKGYFNNSKATDEAFNFNIGWYNDTHFLKTGDTGFFDQDGNLYITGRTRDVLIIHGRNLIPDDIEESIQTECFINGNYLTAAFSIREAYKEQLVIIQEVDAFMDFNLVIEQIHAAVHKNYGISPNAIVLIRKGKLPRTSSGKIKRHACRVLFEAGVFEIIQEKVIS